MVAEHVEATIKTKRMNAKIATVLGSTGLIGSHIVDLLKDDDQFSSVRVLVRRQVSFNHPKIEVVVVNFSDESSFRTGIEGSDVVFCAVGTTNAKVKGDKVAYRKVDYDIAVNAAKYCIEAGCSHFLLVSSVGADSRSKNFYLRLKGEVEEVIGKMNIPSISIFRPSMLLGKRKESRPGETIGKMLAAPVSFLFPLKYRPIQASEVAKAMVTVAKQEHSGVRVYQNAEIKKVTR